MVWGSATGSAAAWAVMQQAKKTHSCDFHRIYIFSDMQEVRITQQQLSHSSPAYFQVAKQAFTHPLHLVLIITTQ